MENIVQSNNRDLRLAAVKVGVLSTLRLSLPDVPANATRVEVIVTNGDTHTAYGAHIDSSTERWLVDVAAAQFPSCGKQKYEIAYRLDGKQFWDGAGWVTVEDATTGGITPSPAPDPARYVVTRINGYGAPNTDGEVRIPRLSVATEDPTTAEGYIEYDQLFNRVTGSLFVLCSVGGTLTWVQTAGGGDEGGGVVLITVDDGVAMRDGAVCTAGDIATLMAAKNAVMLYDGQGAYLPCIAATETKALFSGVVRLFGNTLISSSVDGDGNVSSTEAELAELEQVKHAAGAFAERDGYTTITHDDILLVPDMRYYNITGPCLLQMPINSIVKDGPARWLFHLANGVSPAAVRFFDLGGRTIVTNASPNAYAEEITGDKLGLNGNWKMVTMRIFKNPQGTEIVYLEV